MARNRKPVDVPTTQNSKWRYVQRAAIVILAALLIGFGIAYLRADERLKQLEKNNSPDAAQQEADALLVAVGKHIRLPEEKPAIATVEDRNKLKDQPFFQHAEKGDKVLMYTETKKAILYRPSTDKIIEVAYLNIKRE